MNIHAADRVAELSYGDYRHDIDGLRAIAVLSVVLYHYGATWLPGGFAGVDVFFVISGYLITKHLAEDVERNGASLRPLLIKFYDKRIRRIFPASLVMLLSTLVAGWFLLIPADYANLGKSAAYSALMAGNLFFFWNTDYFDQAADMQPLLHMWSLGVEEQFYLVWPLLLAGLFALLKSNRRIGAVILGAVVLVSLLAANHAIGQEEGKAGFYLPWYRAWELGLGALIVFLPTLRGGRWTSEAVTWAGLALIAWALLTLTATQESLGFRMMPAVVGSAMIVWPRHNVGTVGRLLCGKFMNLTGRLSFSLYLWHWPVVVYFRYYSFGTMPNLLEAVFLFVLSYGLAYVSWRYIEQPVRRVRWNSAVAVSSGIASTAALACLASGINLTQGVPWRLPPEAQALLSVRPHYGPGVSTADCNISAAQSAIPKCLDDGRGKEKILVFGDSHANVLTPSLREAFPNAHITRIAAPGCRFQHRSLVRASCQKLFDAAISQYIPHGSFEKIVWTARWVTSAMDGVPHLADKLSKYGKLYVVGQAVEYSAPLPDLLVSRYILRKSNNPDEFSRYALVKKADEDLKSALERSGAAFFSIADITCVDGICEKLVADGTPLMFDRDHMSLAGSKEVVRRLIEKGLLK